MSEASQSVRQHLAYECETLRRSTDRLASLSTADEVDSESMGAVLDQVSAAVDSLEEIAEEVEG